ncbi:GrpB family protein [Kribbella yunnanensis]|uniref:GrpB family protein n=1 Tax=Kribbella yunnanensis TaxID=190194 RepID=UPI003CD059C4
MEHIGSTALPGLVAKPVIDIAARVEELDALVAWDGRLAELRFAYELERLKTCGEWAMASCRLP